MAKLQDIIAYLCSKYPYKEELSKARLTKMVYLADWRSAISSGVQLSNIKWEFNHFGPYVPDIADLARKTDGFNIVTTTNFYGGLKEVIQVRQPYEYSNLTNAEKKILDFVIEQTRLLNWNDFIKLVYSTYPILTEPKYSSLDLIHLAKKYKEDKKMFVA